MTDYDFAFTIPDDIPFEEQVKVFGDYYNDLIKPGHGVFFNFDGTPEFEKPVLDYLKKTHYWVQETSFFIRKPDLS